MKDYPYGIINMEAGLDATLEPWCDGCRSLRQQLEHVKAEHAINYKTLKDKIIPTDMLIKKYSSKCKEYDNQCKKLEETNKKVELYQRDCDTISKQLKVALEEVEPLKMAKQKWEKKKNNLEKQTEELKVKVFSYESMVNQFRSMQSKQEEDLQTLEQEKTQLTKKVKDLEASCRRTEQSTKKNQDEVEKKRCETISQKKLNTKLQKEKQKLENKLLKCEELLRNYGLFKDIRRLGLHHNAAGSLDVDSITSSIAHTSDILSSGEESDTESIPDVEMIFTKLGLKERDHREAIVMDLLQPIFPAVSPLPYSPVPSVVEGFLSSDSDDSEGSVDDMASHLDAQLLTSTSPVKHKSLSPKGSKVMPTKGTNLKFTGAKTSDDHDNEFSASTEEAASAEEMVHALNSRLSSSESPGSHTATASAWKLKENMGNSPSTSNIRLHSKAVKRTVRVRKLTTEDENFTSRRHSRTPLMSAKTTNPTVTSSAGNENAGINTTKSESKELATGRLSGSDSNEDSEHCKAVIQPAKRKSRVLSKQDTGSFEVHDSKELSSVPEEQMSPKSMDKPYNTTKVKDVIENKLLKQCNTNKGLEIIKENSKNMDKTHGLRVQVEEDLKISSSEDESGYVSPRRSPRLSPRQSEAPKSPRILTKHLSSSVLSIKHSEKSQSLTDNKDTAEQHIVDVVATRRRTRSQTLSDSSGAESDTSLPACKTPIKVIRRDVMYENSPTQTTEGQNDSKDLEFKKPFPLQVKGRHTRSKSLPEDVPNQCRYTLQKENTENIKSDNDKESELGPYEKENELKSIDISSGIKSCDILHETNSNDKQTDHGNIHNETVSSIQGKVSHEMIQSYESLPSHDIKKDEIEYQGTVATDIVKTSVTTRLGQDNEIAQTEPGNSSNVFHSEHMQTNNFNHSVGSGQDVAMEEVGAKEAKTLEDSGDVETTNVRPVKDDLPSALAGDTDDVNQAEKCHISDFVKGNEEQIKSSKTQSDKYNFIKDSEKDNIMQLTDAQLIIDKPASIASRKTEVVPAKITQKRRSTLQRQNTNVEEVIMQLGKTTDILVSEASVIISNDSYELCTKNNTSNNAENSSFVVENAPKIGSLGFDTIETDTDHVTDDADSELKAENIVECSEINKESTNAVITQTPNRTPESSDKKHNELEICSDTDVAMNSKTELINENTCKTIAKSSSDNSIIKDYSEKVTICSNNELTMEDNLEVENASCLPSRHLIAKSHQYVRQLSSPCSSECLSPFSNLPSDLPFLISPLPTTPLRQDSKSSVSTEGSVDAESNEGMSVFRSKTRSAHMKNENIAHSKVTENSCGSKDSKNTDKSKAIENIGKSKAKKSKSGQKKINKSRKNTPATTSKSILSEVAKGTVTPLTAAVKIITHSKSDSVAKELNLDNNNSGPLKERMLPGNNKMTVPGTSLQSVNKGQRTIQIIDIPIQQPSKRGQFKKRKERSIEETVITSGESSIVSYENQVIEEQNINSTCIETVSETKVEKPIKASTSEKRKNNVQFISFVKGSTSIKGTVKEQTFDYQGQDSRTMPDNAIVDNLSNQCYDINTQGNNDILPKEASDSTKNRKTHKRKSEEIIQPDCTNRKQANTVIEKQDVPSELDVKSIERTLQFVMKFPSIKISDIAERLGKVEPPVTEQQLTQTLTHTLLQNNTDVLSDMRGNLQHLSQQCSVNVPQNFVLSDADYRILEFLEELSSRSAMRNVIEVFYTTAIDAIVNNTTAHVLGKCSLLRIFTAICKKHLQCERVKVAVYDILYHKVCGYASLIGNVMAVWPELLRKSVTSGTVEPLPLVLEHILMAENSGSSEKQKTLLIYYQVLGQWNASSSEQLVENLLSTLHSVCQSSVTNVNNNEGPVEVFEVLKCLELLSLNKGWEWTNNVLIINYIWSQLQHWVAIMESPPYCITYVQYLFQLLGRTGIHCPNEHKESIKDMVKTLSILIGPEYSNKVPRSTQLCIIETITLLTPFNMMSAIQTCNKWMAKYKDTLSIKQKDYYQQYFNHYKQRLPGLTVFL